MQLVVGARGSALARAQVREVENEVRSLFPNVTFVLRCFTTVGDRDQKTPLQLVQQADFFTKEIDDAVHDGTVRIGIHSGKDLPNPIPTGLSVFALTRGVDARDTFVAGGRRLEELPPGAMVGTSSARREAHIRAARPDLICVPIRGTIETRLRMLGSGAIDGLIMAEAALLRLRLDVPRTVLDWQTEPLQGRLAVVGRKGDAEMETLFARIHVCPP